MTEDEDRIDRGINQAIDEWSLAIRRQISELHDRIRSVDLGRPVGSFEYAMFTATLNDKGASYINTVEMTTVTKMGLKNAVQWAEAEHALNYGKLRTDGYVDYRVSIQIGREDIHLPVELWQEFSIQSLASIEKARKL